MLAALGKLDAAVDFVVVDVVSADAEHVVVLCGGEYDGLVS